MKYVSLDLETTGLDSNLHQIIEIACVIDDLSCPPEIDYLRKCESYHKIVRHPNYNFSPHAMKMHMRNGLLDELLGNAYVDSADVAGADQVGGLLMNWLIKSDLHDPFSKPAVAGKNFARFDAPFLLKLHGFSIGQEWWHHRSLDVGSLYAKATDTELPSTEECLKRAGLKSGGNHRAMDDALDVVRLVRHALLGKI